MGISHIFPSYRLHFFPWLNHTKPSFWMDDSRSHCHTFFFKSLQPFSWVFPVFPATFRWFLPGEVNFIVVLDGLTNQLLGVIVRSEDQRLEEDKNRLLFQVAKGDWSAQETSTEILWESYGDMKQDMLGIWLTNIVIYWGEYGYSI